MNDFIKEYYFILVFIFVASLFSFFFFFFSYLVIFKTKDIEKLSAYECGFSPFESEGRSAFDIKFYIVGILFIIFDLEIVFFFPWASILVSLSYVGYVSMIVFLVLLLVAFVYEWGMGVLEWGNIGISNAPELNWDLENDLSYRAVTKIINTFKLFRKSNPEFSELLKIFFL